MSFIPLTVIYDSIAHVKAGVMLQAVDPLDGQVFAFTGMTPYPVYTYGLDGQYVDGYQLVDTNGTNHYLPATDVARVQFMEGQVN